MLYRFLSAKKRVLYLIESPFQLIQAAELMQFEEFKGFFVIRFNGIMRNNEQLKSLLELYEIENCFYFDVEKKYKLFLYAPWFLFLSALSKKLVIGDENSFFFKSVKKIFHKNKFLILDDGTASLNKQALTGYNRFTVFSSVIGKKNTLSYNKRKITAGIDSNENVNVVIGGKLSEVGICSSVTYMKLMEKIYKKAAGNGNRIIYVPHRGECSKNIDDIVNSFSFDVVYTSLPVELVGYELNVNPVSIFSVTSTALYTMSLIYDKAEVNICPLKSEEILSHRDWILHLYESMRNNLASLKVMER